MVGPCVTSSASNAATPPPPDRVHEEPPGVTDPTELAFLTATSLLDGFASGAISPVEATTAALDQIDAHNDAVNAFCLVDSDGALAQARAAEQRWQRGEPTGRLDGIPVGIKDLFLVAGWPTRKGSTATDPSGPWAEDAPAVAALRRNGAVLLGKTTTPELGWKGVTDSPLCGVTRNPWDPARTPGGSSGGSAAAIALGMGPVAPGTDGGGSIRIPCAFCGLVGLKPTYGRVPLWPPSPFGTLAHAGPMARTVADATLLLEVLAEPDLRDWRALPPAAVDPSSEAGLQARRVAFSPDLGYVDVHPEVAAAVAQAAQTFADLGAEIEQIDPGFDDPLETFDTLWYADAANAVRDWTEEQRAAMDPGLAEITAAGAGFSALDYLEATRRRVELGVAMNRFHTTYDLLITPSLPIPAFTAGQEVPDGWPQRRWQTWTPLSYPFNLTQQPAASVPCGFTQDGLPIGLQIVAAKHADALVLRATAAYEAANSIADRRPAMASATGGAP
ncbi:MAG: amidase [Egibacteraceae bacterium]